LPDFFKKNELMNQKMKFAKVKTERKHGQILQVRLNSTSTTSVLARVADFISCNVKFTLFTPNPEIILRAQKDLVLLKALNQADLAIPDGVGLKLADLSLKIIKGRELFLDLIALAHKKSWRVFLLGGLGREAEISKRKLEISYRNLRIESSQGPKLDNSAEPVSAKDTIIEEEALARINKFAPQLLFVGFGAPKQEKWIAKNLAKLNIGGAMAVGGTFRYLAGVAKLPPKWLETAGLEWFWRFLTEPQRFSRIFRAVVVFPIKVIIERFK
jgi:N-acetylglucosaminyldiphosphoundecaprenol N-acetyl-beta-D-mannosaminyltransferase